MALGWRTRTGFLRFRPMRFWVGAVVILLYINPVFPNPARAATPLGMLAPGTYALSDYTLGRQYSSSLVVTDVGEYKQRYETGSGVLEVWPVQYSASSFRIDLTDLNLGGIYFEPTYGDSVIYRPFQAPGVLDPWARGSWYMYSGQFGGIWLYTEYTVGEPEYLIVNGSAIMVTKIDMILDFWGDNADGLIRHTHWTVPGSTRDFRDDFYGQLTVLGLQNYVQTSVAHGLLAG